MDAFAGAGGFALGVSHAAQSVGLEPVFAGRIDADAGALAVHKHNLPGGPALTASVADLVNFALAGEGVDAAFAYPPELIGPALQQARGCDVFIAGPPCQGHSILNNHSRRDDPRNTLFITAAALGCALGARAILLEYVATVRNARGGVVQLVESVLTRAGYAIYCAVLRADALGGAQRRARLFLLAVRDGGDLRGVLDRTAEALASPPLKVEEAIGDLAVADRIGVVDTPPEPSPLNRERIGYLFAHGLYDLPESERPACHREGTSYMAVYGRMHPDQPAQTITTGFGASGQGRYIHSSQPRLITPREAARLGGFPDWYDFVQPRPLKRKELQKWIGDAVHTSLGFASGLAALTSLPR